LRFFFFGYFPFFFVAVQKDRVPLEGEKVTKEIKALVQYKEQDNE
jgi:hypothetical protein